MNYYSEAEQEAYQRYLAEKDAERFYNAAESMNGQLEKAHEREANLHEQLRASLSREKVLREALEAIHKLADTVSIPQTEQRNLIRTQARVALASTETENRYGSPD